MATQPTPIGDQPGITPSTPTGPARPQTVVIDSGVSATPTASPTPRATAPTVDPATQAAVTPSVRPRATGAAIPSSSIPSATTAVPPSPAQSSTTVTNNGLLGVTTTTSPSATEQTQSPLSTPTIDQTAGQASSPPPQQVTVITNKPAGNINGEIQFYSNGNFGVDKDFKYDSSTDSLKLNGTIETVNLQVSGRSYLGNADNIWIGGGYVGQYLTATTNGNLGWVSGTQGNSIGAGTSNVSVAPSGNITMSVGGVSNVLTATTTEVVISGNLMPATGNAYSLGSSTRQWKELWVTSNTIYIGNVPLGIQPGNVLTVGNAPVVTEGTVNTGDIQTSANLISNNVQTTTLTANGVGSNNYVLGNTVTTISTTRWLDAITNSTSPTVLFSTANTVSSVDVHITAVQGNSKQITKMLSVTSGAITNYSQYGNVGIGGEVADFTMDQVGGQVRIVAAPKSTALTDYRLVIVLYE